MAFTSPNSIASKYCKWAQLGPGWFVNSISIQWIVLNWFVNWHTLELAPKLDSESCLIWQCTDNHHYVHMGNANKHSKAAIKKVLNDPTVCLSFEVVLLLLLHLSIPFFFTFTLVSTVTVVLHFWNKLGLTFTFTFTFTFTVIDWLSGRKRDEEVLRHGWQEQIGFSLWRWVQVVFQAVVFSSRD